MCRIQNPVISSSSGSNPDIPIPRNGWCFPKRKETPLPVESSSAGKRSPVIISSKRVTLKVLPCDRRGEHVKGHPPALQPSYRKVLVSQGQARRVQLPQVASNRDGGRRRPPGKNVISPLFCAVGRQKTLVECRTGATWRRVQPVTEWRFREICTIPDEETRHTISPLDR